MHLFASLYPLCYTVYGFLRENEEINMKTIVVTLDKEHPDGEAILRAGEIIKAGGLVAFPTETVYGLGGDALNPGIVTENLCGEGASVRQPADRAHLPVGRYLQNRGSGSGNRAASGSALFGRDP